MTKTDLDTGHRAVTSKRHGSMPDWDHGDHGRQVAAVAAGGVLLVASVAGLHHLYRAGDSLSDLVPWIALLLGLLTALGGGIKLIMWGVRPMIAAAFDEARAHLAEPVLAVAASAAVIIGALGMWWTFRGGYASTPVGGST